MWDLSSVVLIVLGAVYFGSSIRLRSLLVGYSTSIAFCMLLFVYFNINDEPVAATPGPASSSDTPTQPSREAIDLPSTPSTKRAAEPAEREAQQLVTPSSSSETGVAARCCKYARELRPFLTAEVIAVVACTAVGVQHVYFYLSTVRPWPSSRARVLQEFELGFCCRFMSKRYG
jgi:hypothetical protein